MAAMEGFNGATYYPGAGFAVLDAAVDAESPAADYIASITLSGEIFPPTPLAQQDEWAQGSNAGYHISTVAWRKLTGEYPSEISTFTPAAKQPTGLSRGY